MSTPINTVSRDNLTVLIMNNMLNNSVEFASDCDTVSLFYLLLITKLHVFRSYKNNSVKTRLFGLATKVLTLLTL